MKLYDFIGAPNPKKVRIYLAEKGLSIELVPIDITQGRTRAPEFRAINPWGGLPVLELDDGSFVPESLAIIEYLEERHPQPSLVGATPERRLAIRSLERKCELGVLGRVATLVQNTHPFFAKWVDQSAETAQGARKLLGRALELLDAEIGERPFVAGSEPTIADCTLYSALWFGHVMQAGIDLAPYPNVARWRESFSKRPSAKA
jgi:glutathione S-transferase